jgi:hypothetical protein
MPRSARSRLAQRLDLLQDVFDFVIVVEPPHQVPRAPRKELQVLLDVLDLFGDLRREQTARIDRAELWD